MKKLTVGYGILYNNLSHFAKFGQQDGRRADWMVLQRCSWPNMLVVNLTSKTHLVTEGLWY